MMKNKRVNSEKLRVMRNYLPQGSNKIIADKTGFTPVYISKVLHGVHLNMNVIGEAIKIALEEKAKSESVNETLEGAFQ